MNLEYEKICNEILVCDKKIRYVAIYDFGELTDKIRPGLKNHLTREETVMSLSQAVYRWSTRKKTVTKIGKPIFALTKYEKIFRITMSIEGAGLVLVSTELDIDMNELVEKVLKIRDQHW